MQRAGRAGREVKHPMSSYFDQELIKSLGSWGMLPTVYGGRFQIDATILRAGNLAMQSVIQSSSTQVSRARSRDPGSHGSTGRRFKCVAQLKHSYYRLRLNSEIVTHPTIFPGRS